MLERSLSQTTFVSQQDFIDNLNIIVPENSNFAYDVVDSWAESHHDNTSLIGTNEKCE